MNKTLCWSLLGFGLFIIILQRINSFSSHLQSKDNVLWKMSSTVAGLNLFAEHPKARVVIKASQVRFSPVAFHLKMPPVVLSSRTNMSRRLNVLLLVAKEKGSEDFSTRLALLCGSRNIHCLCALLFSIAT